MTDQTLLGVNRHTCWNDRDWMVLVVLALVAFAAFFSCLGAFGIIDPSDGYYSEGAREMVESGNWLVPYLNYSWFFDKPIMNYWLIGSSYKIFGITEFASRVPAATCGALLVPGMFAFCRQFFRRRAALLASLALLSSPMWLILGHMSLTDMPLSFFIWVALGSFFSALEGKRPGLAWLGYLSLGCGLLTKGPLALFLVGMNLGIYILIRRPSVSDLLAIILRLHVIPGLILSVAIAAPWYLLVNADTRGAFFQEFFLNQNINRAMGTVDHKAGPIYYLPVLFGAAFPWTLISLAAWRLWFNPFFRYIKKAVPYLSLTNNARCTAFGVTIIFATTLFFSLLPTKLVTYFLPIVPALAMVGGYTFDKLLRLKSAKNFIATTATMLVLIGGLAATVLLMSLSGLELELFRGKIVIALREILAGDALPKAALAAAFCVMGAGSLLCIVFIYIKKVSIASSILVLSVVMSTVLAVPNAIILSFQQKCRDMQNLVRFAREKKISPVMLGRRTPSATFYLGSKVKFLSGPLELGTLLKDEKLGREAARSCFLVHQNVYNDLLQSGQRVSLIKQAGDWVLARNL